MVVLNKWMWFYKHCFCYSNFSFFRSRHFHSVLIKCQSNSQSKCYGNYHSSLMISNVKGNVKNNMCTGTSFKELISSFKCLKLMGLQLAWGIYESLWVRIVLFKGHGDYKVRRDLRFIVSFWTVVFTEKDVISFFRSFRKLHG